MLLSCYLHCLSKGISEVIPFDVLKSNDGFRVK